jgi:hypothetical protein
MLRQGIVSALGLVTGSRVHSAPWLQEKMHGSLKEKKGPSAWEDRNLSSCLIKLTCIAEALY